MALDYALGTMQIDENGQWIDPGSMANVCPARGSVTSESQEAGTGARNSVINPVIPNATNPFAVPQTSTVNLSPFSPENTALPPVENAAPAPIEYAPRLESVPSPESVNNDRNSEVQEIVDSAITNPENVPPVKPIASPNLLPDKSPVLDQMEVPPAPFPIE